MMEAELDHQRTIGRRFAELITQGDAVFLHRLGGLKLPYTVSDAGEQKPFSGTNRILLLQVMKTRGWGDPRFFTAHQALEAGWEIPEAASPVSLQFFNSLDRQGMPLEQPTARRFQVYNAQDLVHGPERGPVPERLPETAVRIAAHRAGVEPGQSGSIHAVAGWAEALAKASPNKEHPQQLSSLSQRLAVMLIDAQADLRGEPLVENLDRHHWASVLAADPLALTGCIKSAEMLAAHIVGQIGLVEAEMRMQKAITAAQQTPGALDLQAAQRRDRYAAHVDALFQDRAAVLAVPFSEKDQAQQLGAIWHPIQRLWFVPRGLDLRAFEAWNPRNTALGRTALESEIIDQFANEMALHGLDTTKVIADGEWHNVRVDSKKDRSNKSGSYVLSMVRDGSNTPSGVIMNHHLGVTVPWRWEGPALTPEQRARLRAQALEKEEKAERDRTAKEAEAADHARTIWGAAQPAAGHAYAERKGLQNVGLRQAQGDQLLRHPEFMGESGKSAIRPKDWYLLVPMLTAQGELRALQAISEDGKVKTFMRGAQKRGTMLVLGATSLTSLLSRNPPPEAVAFAEGLATGVSFRQGSGIPVVVCFDAGGMELVAQQCSGDMSSHTRPVLAVDNDQFFPEQAMGFMVSHLGLNPHARSGSLIEVQTGPKDSRLVQLGDAMADGEWHRAPLGQYSIRLERESDGRTVKAITVELIPAESQRKITNRFRNRGVEAGQVAAAAFAREDRTAHPVLAIPEFTHLGKRPTDWNDLHTEEGLVAVRAAINAYLPPKDRPLAWRHATTRGPLHER